MATTGAVATGTLQLAYTRSGANVSFLGTPLSVPILPTCGLNNGYTQSLALSGYWQPSRPSG